MNDQLIEQARAIHAKAMNCSDLAHEGVWTAHETVNGLPQNNYWAVTAIRTPTAKGVEPFTVWKAHVSSPAMAGLLTFVSTALPQLCDRLEAAENERAAALAQVGRLREALEPFAAFARPRHPVEEPQGRSSIDIITSDGEYDELELRSYVGEERAMLLLDADDFRRAAAALADLTLTPGEEAAP